MPTTQATAIPVMPAASPGVACRPYQICSRTVMDTTDPDISFDSEGISNWWHDYSDAVTRLGSLEQREQHLKRMISIIKEQGKGREYDCVLGLSGGTDSSYMALLAKRFGLRPVVVHFDNGWNSELAVKNIESIVSKLGFELQTFVMDWPEFRDIQRSYFLASVLDLEVPTDHMIFGALYKIAARHRIQFILSGNNIWNEFVLPRAWYYSKFDLANLKGIHQRFGQVKIKKLPALGALARTKYLALGITDFKILNYLPDYKKTSIKAELIAELGWRDYGGKHYESVFTRFYQGYILPRKWNIDKRKAHLSNLICSGDMTREAALQELKNPPYPPLLQDQDKRYVAKKLGFTEDEFEKILTLPNRDHAEFGTDRRTRAALYRLMALTKPVRRLLGLRPRASKLAELTHK